MAINQDNSDCIARLRWLKVIMVLAVGVLLFKLWFLQIVQSSHYSSLALQNRIRQLPLLAPRGVIIDRDGRVLVENQYGFDLVVFRDKEYELEALLDFLVEGLEVDKEELRERFAEAPGGFQPFLIGRDLSVEQVSYVLAHHNRHPELGVVERPLRHYRYGSLAAHLLGYVGEVSAEELNSPEFSKNRPGDLVGKYGLERSYNDWLSGENGRRPIIVDSLGKTLKELDESPPREGSRLALTLDLELQQAAEEALAGATGAVVALNPKNGELLAMASSPVFDPNQFARRLSASQWQEITQDLDHPLQNRVIQSRFSPGSIFKLVTALAALEQGLITPSSTVTCNGSIRLYNHTFRCWSWRTGGHGTLDLVEAIQHSCNIYFYLLGQKLGIDELSRFSKLVGLGRATRIQLEGEVDGLVPSKEWKVKNRGERWYPGETISVSIGQGPILVTPLQLARMMGVLATGRMPDLKILADSDPPRVDELHFEPEHIDAVREGMWRVVNRQGTGRAARVEGFDVCGKTGTVQRISARTRQRLAPEQAEKFSPDAWFVGFAPRNEPEIVVAVLIEGGGSGSEAAAPVAGRVLDFFHRKKQERHAVPTELSKMASLGVNQARR